MEFYTLFGCLLLGLNLPTNSIANDIDPSVEVGSFPTFGESNVIQKNVQIANFVEIGDRNSIGFNTKLEDFVKIGSDNIVGHDSKILGHSKIANQAKIGNGVTIDEFINLFDNAEVNDGSIIDKFATLEVNAILRQNVYIGKYSTVGENIEIPNSVVIHQFVNISTANSVKANEVLMRSPSSLDLYNECASIQNIPQKYLKKVNASLKTLIKTLINELKKSCQQKSVSKLAVIKSLYLIQLHGLKKFNQTLEILKNPGIISSDSGCSENGKLMQKLENEVHFGPDAIKNKLGPGAVQKLKKLVMIEVDSQRSLRVQNDNFCSMTRSIINGGRKITFNKRQPNDICVENNQESSSN